VPTGNESFIKVDGTRISRVQPPVSGPSSNVIIFLHGWTGDENSMGIFSRGLESSWCFFPRGPVQLETGFAWVNIESVQSARLVDFWPATNHLFTEITNWLDAYDLNGLPVYLVGFSQGAAMALSLSLRSDLFLRTACLSGFLPSGSDEYLQYKTLAGREFLLAHGRLDDVVPVELARKSFQVLQDAGAKVDYCEEDVGHKLSKNCFDRLRSFLTP
jgi:phospholipase/carboxylesterase